MTKALQHAFFYNSEDGDRMYDADSFEYWLKKFFVSGVFAGDCQVTANDNMTVSVAGGYANVDGKVKFFEESQTLQLETAGSSYPRIDTVVIERNDAERDVTLKIVTGGQSSSPAATTPVRGNGIYQLVLAQIYVAAGATRILQADITDTRTDTSLCGIVTGAVEQYDFDQFKVQFDAWQRNQKQAFQAWLSEIQGQLTGDLGAKLTLDVDALEKRVDVLEDALGGCSIRVVDALPDNPDNTVIYLIKES